MKRLPNAFAVCVFAAALTACSADPDDSATGGDADVAAEADAGGDTAPDTGPDVAPDTPPDVGPDLAPDEGPDLIEDAVPDALEDLPSDEAADVDVEVTDAGEDVALDVVADTADDVLVDGDGSELCEPRDPIPTSGPYVHVGYGFGDYQDVENCDLVPITFGIQGGAHIWGAFEAGGFDADVNWFFNMDFEFYQEDVLVAEAHYSDTIRKAADPDGGPYHYDSVTVIFHEDLVPEDQLDIPGVMRLHLYREGVVDVTDEVVLIPNGTTF